MHRRKLEELNLMDDFLFYTMVSHPRFGEKFSRKLLQIIFRRKFGKLEVVPQKVYYGSATDRHGMRLDVYLEEEMSEGELLEDATIFDIEPELNAKLENIQSIPKRVRFYHSKIDAKSLKSGEDYKNLKRVIVVMILPFDPFGFNHIVYTIRNACVEVPELEYDDGAKTIFFYTKGKKGNVSKELRELLHYMEVSKKENAKNDALKEIHSMVESVKTESEVSWKYMKIFERERMLREEGREEEKENTERERRRADRLEEEVKLLREKLASLSVVS